LRHSPVRPGPGRGGRRREKKARSLRVRRQDRDHGHRRGRHRGRCRRLPRRTLPSLKLRLEADWEQGIIGPAREEARRLSVRPAALFPRQLSGQRRRRGNRFGRFWETFSGGTTCLLLRGGQPPRRHELRGTRGNRRVPQHAVPAVAGAQQQTPFQRFHHREGACPASPAVRNGSGSPWGPGRREEPEPCGCHCSYPKDEALQTALRKQPGRHRGVGPGPGKSEKGSV
jgi:hypothetical protein